jgi:membrane-associated protease RseP (regulator of RpoE activity)
MMRRTLGLFLALAVHGGLDAQQAVFVGESPGWLGISYEVRWTQEADRCQPRVLVEQVVQGSPAERAGLRPGDVITALDGGDLPAGMLRVAAARLAPGDTVRLRFERDGRSREVTAIADRRPARPPQVIIQRAPGGFSTTTAPIVWVTGDTLIARNLDETMRQQPAGYWYAHSDGRTEYRRLLSGSRTPLDQRVAALLQCAERETSEVAPTRLALREFQARADSLRVVFSRRALARDPDTEDFEIRVHEFVTAPSTAAAPFRIEQDDDGGMFVFRFDDRMMAGLRGVAGAELTELEPELAEYFDNVREGILVLRVADGTPADRSGLRPGDVIVYGAGRRVESVDALRSLLVFPDPGSIELRVVRKGRTRTVTLGRQ